MPMFESPILPIVVVEDSLDQKSEIIHLTKDDGIEDFLSENSSISSISECGESQSPQPNNIIKIE